MSPFARGLLGGVAEGVTETASMLFADEISKRKEERLAKIADRNYARDRADQLADISSQREFQQGLLKEERGFQRERDLARFGQQVTLSELGAQQQKDLMAEAAKYPSSPLGKLLQDRENATKQSDIDALTRQIGMSQLITSTDNFGAITFASPTFGPNNEITELTELGTFGGLGGENGGLRGLDSPRGDTPPAPEIDQDLLREKIDEVEAMPADENGMIMMERGPVNKQDVLRRYRARLISAAPAGSTSRLGFSYTG